MTISGGADVGYQNKSYSVAKPNNWSGITNNGDYTSQFNFRGVMDLGGGLTAGFWNELDFNPASSTTTNQANTAFTGTPFTGQQFVSLTGSFGDLKLGQPNSPGLIAGIIMNPTAGGTNLGSGYSGSWGRLGSATVSGVNTVDGGATGRIIRHEKTAVYSTPSINGFTGQVEYSFGNDKQTSVDATHVANTNQYSSISATYANGPLTAMYFHGEAKGGTNAAVGVTAAQGTLPAANALGANGNVKWDMLGGNYALGATTLYAGWTQTKGTDGAGAKLEDSTSASVAAKYAVDASIDLWANYIDRKSSLAANAAIPHSKLTAVGANYKLNKTSYIYATYENITNVSAATGDSKIFGTGLVVKF